jgi:hypothetical protein
MLSESPLQAVLFQAFRLYLGIAGVALGIYAVDAAWFGNSIRPDTLASYVAKAAQWFCTRLTPDKAIEWIWGWRLDNSPGFWTAYNKTGFYLFTPLITGSFQVWADRLLPANPAWRKSVQGQIARTILVIAYALLFGLFLTVVIEAWPFFLFVVLAYLPSQMFPFDPEYTAKLTIYRDTVKATLIVLISAVVAVLLFSVL